jgi:hypothetical protein
MSREREAFTLVYMPSLFVCDLSPDFLIVICFGESKARFLPPGVRSTDGSRHASVTDPLWRDRSGFSFAIFCIAGEYGLYALTALIQDQIV